MDYFYTIKLYLLKKYIYIYIIELSDNGIAMRKETTKGPLKIFYITTKSIFRMTSP